MCKKFILAIFALTPWIVNAATFTVTSATDAGISDAVTVGKLSWALSQASSSAGPHTINISTGGGNIVTCSADTFPFSGTVGATTVQGPGSTTLVTTGNFSIFTVNGGTLNLSSSGSDTISCQDGKITINSGAILGNQNASFLGDTLSFIVNTGGTLDFSALTVFCSMKSITGGGTIKMPPSAGGTVGTFIAGPGSNFTGLTQDGSGAAPFAGIVIGQPGTSAPVAAATFNNSSGGGNTYSGGTELTGGATVTVFRDSDLGATSAGVVLDFSVTNTQNALVLSNEFTGSSSRAITLSDGSQRIVSGSSSSDVAIWGGQVTGTGGLLVPGPGTLQLTNATNNYSGTGQGTDMTGGVLSVNVNANLGLTTGAPGTQVRLNNAKLQVASGFSTTNRSIILAGVGGTLGVGTSSSATASVSGTSVTSGTALTYAGPGILTWTGTNTYTGGTTFMAGVLAVSADNNLGTGGGLTFNGGTLRFTGAVPTARTVTMTGAGTIGVGAAASSISGAISGSGALTVGESSDIGGSLTLTNANAGFTGSATISPNVTLALTGAGNLTNASQVTANGTLNVGTTVQIGNLAGSGAVTLGTNALTVNETGSTTYSGAVTGAGASSMAKNGVGTLTLSGSSAGYTGTTAVNAGTLSIVSPGIFPGTFNVNNGGTLKGTGTVGPVNVVSGGKIIPGASIGTIFTGPLVLSSGSTTQIEFNGTGQSSLISVTGAATLAGTLELLPQPGTYFQGTTYTYLTTTLPITGTFGNVVILNSNLGASQVTLIYNTLSAQFQISGGSGIFFGVQPPPAGTPALAVFDNLQAQTAVMQGTDFATVITALTNVALTEGNRAYFLALSQLAPDPFSSFEKSTVQTRAFIDDIIMSRCMFCCQDQCKPFSAWIEPFVIHTDQRNELKHSLPQGIGYDAWSDGFVAGFDWRDAKSVVVGAAGGYEMTYLTWKSDYGHGRTHAGFIGGYGTFHTKRYFLDADALVGFDQYRANRHIQFTGIDRHARSSHKGFDVKARLATRYDFRLAKKSNITPYGKGDFYWIRQSRFHEHGANSIDLFVNRKNSYWLRTEAGGDLSKVFSFDCSCLTPLLGIGWVAYFPFWDMQYVSHFRANPTTFSVFGFQGMSSRVSPHLALCWQSNGGPGVDITYRAELSDSVDVQEGSLRFEWRF